jgi:hypothetical protein
MANDTLLVGAFIPPARGDVPVPTDRVAEQEHGRTIPLPDIHRVWANSSSPRPGPVAASMAFRARPNSVCVGVGGGTRTSASRNQIC